MKKYSIFMKVIAVILTVTIIIGILPMTVLAQAVEDEKENRVDIQAMFLRRKRSRP